MNLDLRQNVGRGDRFGGASYARYRVVNITINGNSNYWGFRVNWEDGAGYRDYGHCLGGSDHGKARNETGRSGGTGTGMRTHALTVTRQDSGGTGMPGTRLATTTA